MDNDSGQGRVGEAPTHEQPPFHPFVPIRHRRGVALRHLQGSVLSLCKKHKRAQFSDRMSQIIHPLHNRFCRNPRHESNARYVTVHSIKMCGNGALWETRHAKCMQSLSKH